MVIDMRKKKGIVSYWRAIKTMAKKGNVLAKREYKRCPASLKVRLK